MSEMRFGSLFRTIYPKTNLTAKESELANEILAEVTNVEDLLSLHFARFSERGGLGEKRTFVYLAWTLWRILATSLVPSTKGEVCIHGIRKTRS